MRVTDCTKNTIYTVAPAVYRPILLMASDDSPSPHMMRLIGVAGGGFALLLVTLCFRAINRLVPLEPTTTQISKEK